jgi:predicted GIY-YIG superfamily endonuclease
MTDTINYEIHDFNNDINNINKNDEIINVSSNKPSYVYLLVSTSGTTYIGATIDLDHRLRQHNKELKGGAHATSAKVNVGESWRRVCHVAGFPDWRAALQFEWRWKQIGRQIIKNGFKKCSPLARRAESLKQLLLLERPTTKAQAYSEWSGKPQVIVETDVKEEKELFAFYTLDN